LLGGERAKLGAKPKRCHTGGVAQPGDGYTFLVASGFITVAPEFQSALKWSYKTFVPVGLMVVGPPNVFVVPANSPFATLLDFARAAKARPRQINVGTPSLGSSIHLGLELFYSVANIETFAVPYQGAAAVVAPVLRGDVAFTMLSQSMISSFVPRRPEPAPSPALLTA
jgi:tripartite-type tricarboxylate transporter receptor subunit TctC